MKWTKGHAKRLLAGLLAAAMAPALAACAQDGESDLDAPPPPPADISAASGEAPPEDPAEVLYFRGAPTGVALLPGGELLVADGFSKVVWQVDEAGAEPAPFAGRVTHAGASGEPIGGYYDDAAQEALFASPWAVAPYLSGYAVSDPLNNVLRYVQDGSVYTAAGTGARSGADEDLSLPTGLAADTAGNLYIAETGGNRIRLMDPDTRLTDYAGDGEAGSATGPLAEARFRQPTGLAWQDGALYVADSGNHRICKIQGGQVTVVAGTIDEADEDQRAAGGYRDGPAAEAQFSNPQGIALAPDGAIYVADTGNGLIRRIRDGRVETLATGRATEEGEALFPVDPVGLLIHGGYLYVCDEFSGIVYRQALSGL